MKVRPSESAVSDVDNVFSYIEERNRTAATAVVGRIKAVAKLLEDFPEAGHPTDEPGVRMFPVVRYPYLVFYAIDSANAESSSSMCAMGLKSLAPEASWIL